MVFLLLRAPVHLVVLALPPRAPQQLQHRQVRLQHLVVRHLQQR